MHFHGAYNNPFRVFACNLWKELNSGNKNTTTSATAATAATKTGYLHFGSTQLGFNCTYVCIGFASQASRPFRLAGVVSVHFPCPPPRFIRLHFTTSVCLISLHLFDLGRVVAFNRSFENICNCRWDKGTCAFFSLLLLLLIRLSLNDPETKVWKRLTRMTDGSDWVVRYYTESWGKNNSAFNDANRLEYLLSLQKI